jgi:ubiquinone/menaquinone biosynthesis C-methylase UbiE
MGTLEIIIMVYTRLMSRYADSVSTEIIRLEKLGWQDWRADFRSVKISPNVKKSEISFPLDWYNPECQNMEADGIWAATRARNILKILSKNEVNVIWEVGAGNGNAAIPLKKAGIGAIGIEPLSTGAESLVHNGIIAYEGTLEDLAFPDSCIDAIGIFDVLEHLEHPETVLTEIRRVLKPGGLLIVSVPANQWLFSDFDLSIGHFRRYSRNSLRKLLEKNGFVSNKIKYLFLSFVPPAFFLRALPYKFGRRRQYQSTIKSNQSLAAAMKRIEPLLEAIFKIEDRLHLPTERKQARQPKLFPLEFLSRRLPRLKSPNLIPACKRQLTRHPRLCGQN